MLLSVSTIRFVSGSIIATFLFAACEPCRPYYYDLPERPSSVRGWTRTPNGTVLTIADVVLNKGESSEGKFFAVKLVEIKPAALCHGLASEPSSAEITFRFYRPSTGETLCQTTISLHGKSNSGSLQCPEAAQLPPSIGINAYNAKEGWVWFDLAGTVGDTRW